MRVFFALLLITNAFAFINPGGYYGYTYTPTPNSIDEGNVGYGIRFNFKPGSFEGISHSVIMRPLSFMELGLGIKKSPVPAAKFILPFYDEGEKLALGFSGKNWYFTGSAHGFTVAGVYDSKLNTPVGSVAAELDIDYAVFAVENFWYQNRYGASAIFTLRPLTAFNIPSYVEASTGVSWRSPEYTKGISLYTSVQAKAPILQTDKDPIVYIDINPAFDHSVTFARNIYPIRLALDMDAVLAVPYDFYMVGAISPSLKTKNQDRMPKREFLDRYYLLWDREKSSNWAACGMLNTDIYGCQTQIGKKFYNKAIPLAITLGYTKGDQDGINAIGQIPLHPQFFGFFSHSQLFAEGGLFLGENLATQLNFRQGTDRKFLQIGSGYDFERKSIFGELSFQYDFSISKQISGAAIRLTPNFRHRENSDFYVFDYDVPIYQEGNNARRLHNFPWRK
ncbi:MAG: hypothetical protein FWC15_00915 [Fibromonadales bacterium]|nr:hypothetical protein [Fibromonadales bacterium]